MRRFPLVVVAVILATVCAMAANHWEGHEHFRETLVRIVQLCLLAFPLFVGAAYAGELRPRWRRAVGIAALLVLAGLWFRIPADHAPFGILYGYFGTVLAVLFLAGAVPGLGGGLTWWRINVGAVQALVLAFVASAIVAIGLQIAVYSISELFGLKLDEFHFDAFLIVALLFAPLAVIALLPAAREQGPLPLEGVWRNLGQWVLVPLGFLFLGIIAAYAGLIFLRRELPDGMVATPVLALGAYGTAAMLLLQPWRESHAAARWFARLYPVAFLLASILLFIALAERLNAYGMTLDRYTALVAGVWFVFAAVVFLRRVANAGGIITAAAMILALAASFGPLSAATLSLRSQTARLKALLAAPDREQNAEQIRSGIGFLAMNFGLESLEKATGPLGLDAKLKHWELEKEAAKKLGVSDISKGDFIWNGDAPLAVAGFSALYDSNQDVNCALGTTEDGQPLRVSFSGGEPRVMAGDKKVVDLLPAIMETLAAGKVADPPQIPFTADGREFVLVLRRANSAAGDAGVRKVWSYSYFVLEK